MPNSILTNDIRKHDYTLIITAPNGDKNTFHWDVVDNTGGELTTTYVPDQVGTYNATFNYGGQTYPTLDRI